MSISLTRYLVEEQRAKGRIPSELRLLLEVVARAGGHLVHEHFLGDAAAEEEIGRAHV